MRIFLGEYICGGGLIGHCVDSIPSSLLREGAAMLTALKEDLSAFADVLVPIDPRIAPVALDGMPQGDWKGRWIGKDRVSAFKVSASQPFLDQWIQQAKTCDAAIVIAPESDHTLHDTIEAFRSSAINIVAPNSEFTRIASDKWVTAQRLISAGVAHPATWSHAQVADLQGRDFRDGMDSLVLARDELSQSRRFILKPRDGCGSDGIVVCDHFHAAIQQMKENQILQPWLPGQSISVSVIANERGVELLPAVTQSIDPQTLQYFGGKGPLSEVYQARAHALVRKALTAMPKLGAGFVGFDLVLDDDEQGDRVIEINPRMTTSYVGLRKIVSGNLAKRIFNLESEPLNYRHPGQSVVWTPDGLVETAGQS